jgi:hypothetical protein
LESEEEGAMKNIEIFAVQKLLDFIKTNKGKTGVAFETKDYYSNIFDLYNYIKVYVPVKFENGTEIKVFIDFKAANGTLDLSRNTSNLYNHIGLSIDLKDEYHTGFYVNFKSADNTKLIELWTKTYDEYKAMLDYLGFRISDEGGINYFVNQYKTAITEAKGDCNKLDVIFETVPPFVLPKLGDDGNWASLSSLLNCSKSTWGTNEYQAIANLLNGFTPGYLYNKVNENKKLFRELIGGVPESLLSEYILAFSNAGASKWTDHEIESAGSAYAQPFEVRLSTEEVMLNFDESYVMYVGLYSLDGKDMAITSFQLGRGYSTFKDGEPLYKRQDVLELNTYDYFSPVNLSFNEGCDITIPAFMAYEIVKRYAASSPAVQMLQLSTSVLLPELTLVKLRNLARIFRIRKAATVETKLITEAELTNLTKVKPTGANNSYIGATEIANNAKRATPAANSTIANKVDDYINTTSTSTRGTIGEEIAEELVRDMDGFTNYPCKLNASDNGFDVVAVKGTLENPIEIRLLESKPMNNGSVSLGTTASKGTQMSDDWIRGTIDQMRTSGDANLQSIGNMLRNNFSKIERFVTTVDKGNKQIVIIKLNPF